MANKDFQNGFAVGLASKGVVGAGGASGAQTDWEVTDTTSMAYLKNRPFYQEEDEETIDNGFDVDYSGEPTFLDKKINLNIGENMTVTVTTASGAQESTSQILDLHDMEEELPSCPLALFEDGDIIVIDGAKYTGSSIEEGNYTTVMINNSDYLNVKYENSETVTTIIGKSDYYLPTLQADWEQEDDEITSYIRNKPFGEFVTASETTEITLTASEMIIDMVTELEAGETYTATYKISGEEYAMTGEGVDLSGEFGFECVGVEFSNDDIESITFIPHIEVIDDSPVYSETKSYIHDNNSGYMEGASLVLNIPSQVVVLKKIDEKFLPAQASNVKIVEFRNEPMSSQPVLSDDFKSILDTYPDTVFFVKNKSSSNVQFKYVPGNATQSYEYYSETFSVSDGSAFSYDTAYIFEKVDGEYKIFDLTYGQFGVHTLKIPSNNFSIEYTGKSYAGLGSLESGTSTYTALVYLKNGSSSMTDVHSQCKTYSAWTYADGKYSMNVDNQATSYCRIGNTPAEILCGNNQYYTYYTTIDKKVKINVSISDLQIRADISADRFHNLLSVMPIAPDNAQTYSGEKYPMHYDASCYTQINKAQRGNSEYFFTNCKYAILIGVTHGSKLIIRNEGE